MSNEVLLQPPSELIKVKQLPVIEQQLQAISENMQAQCDEALALEATEKSVAQVRAKRAELNRTFKDLEERRIAVKRAIMAPYDEFEDVYKKYITDIHKPTDAKLKARIDSVDQELIDKKKAELKEFFGQLIEETEVDFITFESLGLNVTRSASMNKLRTEIEDEFKRITDDIAVIETTEYASEILVEYKQSLDLAKAVLEVNKRKELLEAELKRQEEAEAQREKEEAEKQATKEIEAVLASTPTAQDTSGDPVVEEQSQEKAEIPFEPMPWEVVDETPMVKPVTVITVTAHTEGQIKAITDLCNELALEHTIVTKEVV